MIKDQLAKAICDVRANRAQRICAPGKWRVWRGEDKEVKHEILSSALFSDARSRG